MTADPKIQRLREMRAQARTAGGQARIDRQHAQGKLTARERVERYFTRKKVTPAPEVKTEDKEITENMRAYWIERQDCDPSVGAD